MKKLFFLVLFAPALTAQGQEWSLMKSKDGKASVLIPEIPELVTQSMPTEAGNVTMNMQILDLSASGGDNMAMGLMTMEYPPNILDSIATDSQLKTFYDGAMNGAVGNVGGTLLSQSDFELNGHLGRQFSVDFMGGMAVMTMKYVQIGQVGYLQQIISTGDAKDNEEAKRFMESLKLEDN